jgi:hypothetical protein
VRQRRRSGSDEVLALELAAGHTQRVAGNAAGIAERTVRRRLQEPEFAALVDAVRLETRRQLLLEIVAGARAALCALGDLLDDDSVPPAVRLGAARALLEAASKQGDVLEFDRRLRTLEAVSGDRGPQW